jgi:hypothetical protein
VGRIRTVALCVLTPPSFPLVSWVNWNATYALHADVPRPHRRDRDRNRSFSESYVPCPFRRSPRTKSPSAWCPTRGVTSASRHGCVTGVVSVADLLRLQKTMFVSSACRNGREGRQLNRTFFSSSEKRLLYVSYVDSTRIMPHYTPVAGMHIVRICKAQST